MRNKLAAAIVAVCALVLTACSGASPNTAGETQELRIGAISPIASFEPGNFDAGPGSAFIQPVYDTILRNDSEGEPQPSIATEWSYDDSGTELSLTLRDDVTFTDGAKLDAEAVKANLEAAKAGTGETAGQLRFIDTVTVEDPTHLTISLSAVDPSLLTNLGGAAGSLASPETLGTPELATTPVGSGPYVFDAAASQTGVTYAYTRNPDYWNADDFPFDGITITVFNDGNAVTNALRSGQIDFAGISDQAAETLESDRLKVESFPAYTASGVFLFDRNGTIVPALADVRVRQAINMAFDREQIVEQVYAGVGTPTAQSFSESSAAFDPSFEKYEHDVDAAKALLVEAGYADGFTLPMPDLGPIDPKRQAAVTEALTAIGITPQYEPVNGETFISDLLSGKYPAAIFNLNSHRPWDFAQLALLPDSLWNPFHTTDENIVDLVNMAQTQTGEEADATFRELNEYIVDQAWFATLVQPNSVFGVSSAIDVEPRKFSTWPPIWNFTPAS